MNFLDGRAVEFLFFLTGLEERVMKFWGLQGGVGVLHIFERYILLTRILTRLIPTAGNCLLPKCITK